MLLMRRFAVERTKDGHCQTHNTKQQKKLNPKQQEEVSTVVLLATDTMLVRTTADEDGHE